MAHPDIREAVVNVVQTGKLQPADQKIRHCVRCGLSSNYPNIRNEFKLIMQRLQDGSIVQKIAWNGSDQEVELKWPPIAAKIARMLYSDDQYVQIPYLVHELYLENYKPLLETMNITNTETDFFFADGLWLSNICAEDLPVAVENYSESEKESFLSDYVFATRKYACDH